MKTYVRLILSALILLCWTPSFAVVFVSTTGNDGNTGLSWAQAKRTIQAGATLAASQPDLTVWVEKNTVLVTAYVENITVPTGVLIYGGFDGTEDPATFNLDDRVFSPPTVVQPLVSTTSIFTTSGTNRIDGFTIENGAALLGGGIKTTDGTSLIVANCIFNNTTSHYGAGIYAQDGYLSVSNTEFSNESAADSAGNPGAYGGAIYTNGATLIVADCIFWGDNAQIYTVDPGITQGGAIYAEGGTSVTVQRSKFTYCNSRVGNVTMCQSYGGAIYIKGVNAQIKDNIFYDCGAHGAGDTETSYGGAIAFENPGIPNIINNTFYGNSVTPNAGLVTDTDRPYGLGAAIYLSGSGPAIVLNNIISQSRGTAVVNEGMTVNFNYNLLWHNAGGDIFGFSFPFYSTNPALNKDFNIMKDPQYYDKYAGDFHITYGSPAKDAGYNTAAAGTYDIDGETRIINGTIDIGADEFHDTDNDGGADIVDPQPLVFNLPDTDADGISDIFDNAPTTSNPTQTDSNGDGIGDVDTPLSTGASPLAYYVDGTVVSSGDGTTWATAFKTIQEAIDAADSHNQTGWTQNYVVWVRGGPAGQTYYENIMIWHGVAVYGGWSGFPVSPTDVPSPYPLRDLITNQTTINGGGFDSVVVIAHLPQDRYLAEPLKTTYDNTHSVLDAFTVTNGDAELGGGVSIYKEFADVSSCQINENTAALGGGVYIYDSSAIIGDGITPPPATLLSGDTTIYGNTATGVATYAGYGGGIYTEQGAPTIFAERIEDNTAFFGGGIASRESAPIIVESLIGCSIMPNIALGDGTGNGKGGGIYLDNGCDAAMNKLTIVSNAANGATGQGGGIYDADSNFRLRNSIVAFNTAAHAVAAQRGGAIFATGTQPVMTDPWCYITYTDFYNNSATQFVGLPDPTSASPIPECPLTNLAVDPLFVDPSTCNYRLDAASPLIGAGDPADGSPNMGAFQEEDPPVSISEAKKLGNGVLVEVSGVVVTAVFDDGFYVQELDRISGIKVRTYSPTVSVGQMVKVEGVMTTTGIEREIMNPKVTLLKAAAGELKPLCISNSALGGGSFEGQTGVWGWEIVTGPDGKSVKQWKSASGLNNIGLLVTTWGTVKEFINEARPYMLINDGSLNDVRVYLPDDALDPEIGKTAVVTGISTIVSNDSGSTLRAVRSRTRSDLTYYPQ
ncbi:right-handed parallel beta-helix repeat-containing protein [bacterium]|nr:right-handed parallel beta-helix repeat-containing protein [bacterium]